MVDTLSQIACTHCMQGVYHNHNYSNMQKMVVKAVRLFSVQWLFRSLAVVCEWLTTITGAFHDLLTPCEPLQWLLVMIVGSWAPSIIQLLSTASINCNTSVYKVYGPLFRPANYISRGYLSIICTWLTWWNSRTIHRARSGLFGQVLSLLYICSVCIWNTSSQRQHNCMCKWNVVNTIWCSFLHLRGTWLFDVSTCFSLSKCYVLCVAIPGHKQDCAFSQLHSQSPFCDHPKKSSQFLTVSMLWIPPHNSLMVQATTWRFHIAALDCTCLLCRKGKLIKLVLLWGEI